MVRSRRLELPRVAPQRPQRCASTNSATTARRENQIHWLAAFNKLVPNIQASFSKANEYFLTHFLNIWNAIIKRVSSHRVHLRRRSCIKFQCLKPNGNRSVYCLRKLNFSALNSDYSNLVGICYQFDIVAFCNDTTIKTAFSTRVAGEAISLHVHF